MGKENDVIIHHLPVASMPASWRTEPYADPLRAATYGTPAAAKSRALKPR